jgi:hypothetical protein
VERLPVELRGVKTDDDDSGGALQEGMILTSGPRVQGRSVAYRQETSRSDLGAHKVHTPSSCRQ